MIRPYTNTGWLIRDSNGQVVLAGCAQLQPSTSPLQAEALEFLHICSSSYLGLWTEICVNVWFEGDNQELTTLIFGYQFWSRFGSIRFQIFRILSLVSFLFFFLEFWFGFGSVPLGFGSVLYLKCKTDFEHKYFWIFFGSLLTRKFRVF